MSVSLFATGVQTPVNYFLCCGHIPCIENNAAAVSVVCILVVPVGHYFAVLQVQAQFVSSLGKQQQRTSNG